MFLGEWMFFSHIDQRDLLPGQQRPTDVLKSFEG
jgi:hypothetical protein